MKNCFEVCRRKDFVHINIVSFIFLAYKDDLNVAHLVATSRDNLLSTDSNDSDRQPFNNLLLRAANTLWRYMTNGNGTPDKSKSE
jgi:hypothetical protein